MPAKQAQRRDDNGEGLRIDAITAESLIPGRHIKWVSPDASSVLYYNTKTLIEVGKRKGRLLQPPHFREPMTPEMKRVMCDLEGEAFLKKVFPRFSVDCVADEIDADTFTNVDDAEIQHHERVRDIVLNTTLERQNIYVCPLCYEHAANTRYVPYASVTADGVRVGGFRGAVGSTGAELLTDEEQLQACNPLDVLDELTDEEVVKVLFANASEWKRHVQANHSGTLDARSAEGNLVRDHVERFINVLNALKARSRRFQSMYNTTQQFWARDARYNTFRYNKLVELLSRADRDPEATAFPGVELQTRYWYDNEDEDDFIDDEEREDDDENPAVSRSSSASNAGSPCGVCNACDHSAHQCRFIVIDRQTLLPRYCGDAEAKRRRRWLRARLPHTSYSFGGNPENIFAKDAVPEEELDQSEGEAADQLRRLLQHTRRKHRLNDEDLNFQQAIAKHEERAAVAEGIVHQKPAVQVDIRHYLRHKRARDSNSPSHSDATSASNEASSASTDPSESDTSEADDQPAPAVSRLLLDDE